MQNGRSMKREIVWSVWWCCTVISPYLAIWPLLLKPFLLGFTKSTCQDITSRCPYMQHLRRHPQCRSFGLDWFECPQTLLPNSVLKWKVQQLSRNVVSTDTNSQQNSTIHSLKRLRNDKKHCNPSVVWGNSCLFDSCCKQTFAVGLELSSHHHLRLWASSANCQVWKLASALAWLERIQTHLAS